MQIDSFLFVRYYERYFRDLTWNHPFNTIVSEEERLTKIENFRKNSAGSYCCMIDQKKGGNTIPHNLLEIVCQEIDKIDPRINAWRLIKCLKNAVVYDKEQMYTFKRGHGLGILFYLYNVVHLVVAEITGKDSLVFHDDVVYRMDYKADLSLNVEYQNICKIYESLDFIVNKSKSLVSKGFIFLEDFYDVEVIECKKHGRFSHTLFNLIFQRDLEDTKIYLSSISSIAPIYADELFQLIRLLKMKYHLIKSDDISFEDNIRILPISLGGWGLYESPSEMDYTFVNLSKCNDKEIDYVKKMYYLNREQDSYLSDRRKLKNNHLRGWDETYLDMNEYLVKYYRSHISTTERNSKIVRNLEECSNRKRLSSFKDYIIRKNNRRRNELIDSDRHSNKTIYNIIEDYIDDTISLDGELRFAIPKVCCFGRKDMNLIVEKGSKRFKYPRIDDPGVITKILIGLKLLETEEFDEGFPLPQYNHNLISNLSSFSYNHSYVNDDERIRFFLDSYEDQVLKLNSNPHTALEEFYLREGYLPNQILVSANIEVNKFYRYVEKEHALEITDSMGFERLRFENHLNKRWFKKHILSFCRKNKDYIPIRIMKILKEDLKILSELTRMRIVIDHFKDLYSIMYPEELKGIEYVYIDQEEVNTAFNLKVNLNLDDEIYYDFGNEEHGEFNIDEYDDYLEYGTQEKELELKEDLDPETWFKENEYTNQDDIDAEIFRGYLMDDPYTNITYTEVQDDPFSLFD